MQTYKTLTRTTLAQTDDLPLAGIYVLAYMGTVVYAGKAEGGIANRLKQHWLNRLYEPLGDWMDKLIHDWDNVRLDVLEAPDDCAEYWLRDAERAVINRFQPLFNDKLVSEAGGDDTGAE